MSMVEMILLNSNSRGDWLAGTRVQHLEGGGDSGRITTSSPLARLPAEIEKKRLTKMSSHNTKAVFRPFD